MRYAYRDYQGTIVIPFDRYFMCFTDTFKTISFVAIPQQGYWAVNRQGEKLFDLYPDDNGPDRVRDGLFRIVGKDDLIGFANMDGELVIEPRFKNVNPFREGFAAYCDSCLFEPYVEPGGYINEKKSKKLKGKYGFINKKGEVAITP